MFLSGGDLTEGADLRSGVKAVPGAGVRTDVELPPSGAEAARLTACRLPCPRSEKIPYVSKCGEMVVANVHPSGN